jgi:hypothetical protein
MIGALFLWGSAEATFEDDKALIVVSSFGGTDKIELEKAIDLYNYFITNGMEHDDILFLCDQDLAMIDGDPTVSNVKEGFKWLEDEGTSQSDVFIYVSDHAHGTQNEIFYRFSDGILYSEDIEDSLDDMTFNELTYITTGAHSGHFGGQLEGPSRIIMSSMKATENAHPDQFDIARGLTDPTADTNNDGIVTFEEAFYKERSTVTGQEPQIWT